MEETSHNERRARLGKLGLRAVGAVGACVLVLVVVLGGNGEQMNGKSLFKSVPTADGATCTTFAEKRAVVEKALTDMSKLTTTNQGDSSLSGELYGLFAQNVKIVDPDGVQTCPQESSCLGAYAAKVGQVFVSGEGLVSVETFPHPKSGLVFAEGVEEKGSVKKDLIGEFGVDDGTCKITLMKISPKKSDDKIMGGQISKMFDLLDKNEDGHLNFEEFLGGVASHAKVPASLVNLGRVKRVLKQSFEDLREHGEETEADQLSKKSLINALKKNGKFQSYLDSVNVKDWLMTAYHGNIFAKEDLHSCEYYEIEHNGRTPCDGGCTKCCQTCSEFFNNFVVKYGNVPEANKCSTSGSCCVWDGSSVGVRRSGQEMGLMRADEVVVGDDVWGGSERGWETVWYVREGDLQEMVSIGFVVDGSSGGEISLTGKHLLFNGENDLVAADSLKVGDTILTSEGKVGVVVSVSSRVGTVRSLITVNGVLDVNGVKTSSYSHSSTYAKWMVRLLKPFALASKHGNGFMRKAVVSVGDLVAPVLHPGNFHGKKAVCENMAAVGLAASQF